jgi:hypothetical protein
MGRHAPLLASAIVSYRHLGLAIRAPLVQGLSDGRVALRHIPPYAFHSQLHQGILPLRLYRPFTFLPHLHL